MGIGADSPGLSCPSVVDPFQHTAMIPPCAIYLFHHHTGVREGSYSYHFTSIRGTFETVCTQPTAPFLSLGKAGRYGQGTVVLWVYAWVLIPFLIGNCTHGRALSMSICAWPGVSVWVHTYYWVSLHGGYFHGFVISFLLSFLLGLAWCITR
jgi:hypothetical protein